MPLVFGVLELRLGMFLRLGLEQEFRLGACWRP
jgi:hypothetical protein